MPGYAAFLRGVNLGSRRKTGSAELRTCFEGLGFEEVATFRTSGNVVFQAGRESQAKLAARIETGLEQAFGFDVEVFLRSAAEVRAIAEQRPFADKLLEASKGKLQVSMLTAKPAAGVRKQVLALATDEDRLAFGERELYWLPSGGTRDSALDSKAIAKLLGSTTMRTKGTVEALAAKHFGS
jgi:uncharacterized protein (DUF1697 family)